MPTMKSVGRTVRGVRIGCHAFNRCCLNAVSAKRRPRSVRPLPSIHHNVTRHLLAGFRQLPFSFLAPSSSPAFLRLNKPMQVEANTSPRTAKPVQRRKRWRPAEREKGRRWRRSGKRTQPDLAGSATTPDSAFRGRIHVISLRHLPIGAQLLFLLALRPFRLAIRLLRLATMAAEFRLHRISVK